MNPQLEEEQKAIEQAIDERRSNAMSNEEVASKLQESTKASEEISSDMDEAARVAEEALKRLNGEM